MEIIMAMYNDIVMKHFTDPQNVGEIENPDGIGTYGSPVCGDMMQITIKVENDVITDMIIGKTIDDALEISNKQIINELGGLPPVKIHCSVLADHAIKAAIYDYAQKHNKTYAGLEGFDPNAEEDDHHDIGDE